MAEKNWTTGFPAALDSNTNMPSLINGDTGLPSQSNAVKDAVIQIENVLGSDNLESGSVRQKVEALEQNSATKTLLDSYATLLDLDTKADLSLLDDYAQKTLLDSYAQLAHNTQHQSGGSDAIKLDALAAPDDNTDLNATASAHGLLPKLSNIATEFLNGQGSWATPAGGGGGSGLVDGYLPFPERVSDPNFIDNYGNLYTKQDDDYGTTELFYQDSLGNVTQITQDGYLATYNSLRGVRLLTGTNFIADPNSVVLFAKNVGGVTELFIKDDLQNEIQVTSEGSVVSSPINISDIDGYISFFGNELDPNMTTGTENQLVLDFSPADEYALSVYRNGLLMRRVNALSDDYQEYTLSGNVVGFLPTNVSGNWYFAQAIDGYSRFGALVDGVLQLPDTTDPLFVSDIGQLYSKEVDGYSELHYRDDYGLITQITNRGEVLGGGASGWNYLQVTQPSGVSTPPVALYQFDGTADALNDRSGNSRTLTMFSGNAYYAAVDNLMGFYCVGNNRLWHNATPSDLQLDRAITVEMQMQLLRANAAEEHLFSISGTNEVLKENELCQISRAATTGILTIFVEYGAGTNSAASSPLSMANTGLSLLTFTRASNGLDCKFYLNGTNASVATLPTAAGKDVSGNLQKLYIGNTTLIAIICSVRITAVEFTAAQVLESYNTLRA